MPKLPLLLTCLATLFASSLAATAAESFGTAEPFKAEDTLCFVGDSITHGGTTHSIVMLYYATRFPERAIQSSTAASAAIARVASCPMRNSA